MITRRPLILALLALPCAAIQAGADELSAQDHADIARIETYLNGLAALKARFLQVAPDGAIARGTAWLERPGRMRFQYDPPSPFLLVAGHGLVVFHDSQLDQTSNIPLGSTPLGILLAADVRLSGDVTVTSLSRLPGQIQLTVVRTASPGDGSLTLVFSDPPLALKQWIVLDAQRQETRVSLFDLQFGGAFDPKLFDYVDPKALGGRGSNAGGG